jgi:LPXTG-site transpeptidase (sortase) family protein
MNDNSSPQLNEYVKAKPLIVGAMAAILVLASSLACQLEIGTGRAIAKGQVPTGGEQSQILAAVEFGGRTPVGTPIIVSSVTTDTPQTVVAVIQLTPSPTATATKPPTATPTPVIPALTPPDRIRASAINLDVPVTPIGWTEIGQDGQTESVWVVPDDMAGWHQNSAMPGNGGNVVLSGHHNMGSEVFRYLVDLKPDDEIVIHADGRDYYYVVSDCFILPDRNVSREQRIQNAQWIKPTNEERLTLVTCWPYNDNSHRVIVIATPK